MCIPVHEFARAAASGRLLATRGTEENPLTPELARKLAGEVRCPALVLHGDADGISPLARGEDLARLAGAEPVVLTGSGHEPHYLSPDVVDPLLTRFLEQAGSNG